MAPTELHCPLFLALILRHLLKYPSWTPHTIENVPVLPAGTVVGLFQLESLSPRVTEPPRHRAPSTTHSVFTLFSSLWKSCSSLTPYLAAMLTLRNALLWWLVGLLHVIFLPCCCIFIGFAWDLCLEIKPWSLKCLRAWSFSSWVLQAPNHPDGQPPEYFLPVS